VFEKSGVGKTRYVHGARAYHVRRVSTHRSQFFYAGYFPPMVHTKIMFSAGVGSLSLMLEVDGFGFT
jgi:hypothetical protein